MDHLERATESIGLNLVRGNSQRGLGGRLNSIDIAVGSLLECVACLDVAYAKEVLQENDLDTARTLLWRIRGMLVALKNSPPKFIKEDSPCYGSPQFPHDRLDVYRLALQLVAWMHRLKLTEVLPTRVERRLDTVTTGIPLNIAEGSGKPVPADRCRYLRVAYNHTLQAALSLDLLAVQEKVSEWRVQEGKEFLERISAMLAAWGRQLAG